jgi:hypothetical protein
MMNEYATLKIEKFRDPEGNHVCMNKEKACIFLRTTNFGTRNICHFNSLELYRNKGGKGFIQPREECPIWSQDDNT